MGIRALSRIKDILKSNHYDAVWVNRNFSNLLFLEKCITSPLVYDIDDAIWINNEKAIGKIASKAEMIIAGNEFIGSYLEKYNSKIFIVPTAIDTKRFSPSKSQQIDTFNIVWTGSRETMHYLLSIEKPLSIFLNQTKNSKLIVISDSRPRFSIISADKLKFIPWSHENEVFGIQQSNVGLMPLFNTQWEQGKCSFKMLQYMACGLPVIVSPVGMNNEVFSRGEIGLAATKDDDWISGLKFFYKNREEGKRMGSCGRQVIYKYYSLSVASDSLAQIFGNL
jgi:glycosyltransferase involved in cell wall biosynthesis